MISGGGVWVSLQIAEELDGDSVVVFYWFHFDRAEDKQDFRVAYSSIIE